MNRSAYHKPFRSRKSQCRWELGGCRIQRKQEILRITIGGENAHSGFQCETFQVPYGRVSCKAQKFLVFGTKFENVYKSTLICAGAIHQCRYNTVIVSKHCYYLSKSILSNVTGEELWKVCMLCRARLWISNFPRQGILKKGIPLAFLVATQLQLDCVHTNTSLSL